MVEKLSQQQNVQLNKYLKEHPKASRSAAIQLLFGNKGQHSTSSKGLKIEHNTNGAAKPNTIYLQSGRKVVYTRTKDGKLACKYYGADGTLIKPEYFKKVEGNISISADNNSYTVTKNGKSVKHAAKNPRKAQIDQNIVKLNNQEKSLKRTKKEQGFIGKSWDWFKNTSAGQILNLDGSNKAQKQIDEERKLLVQLRDNPDKQIDPKKFEKVTGQKYTKANLTKFQQGEFSSAKAKVDAYKEGQTIAVDVASDLVSGVAAFGIYTAAVAAAPFTGGASIAVGVAAAGVVGAGSKIAIKAADTIGTNRKYNLFSKEAASDALMGSVNGLIAPLTAGAGGAVAKTLAIRGGVQVVKETGKQATKQVLSQATKNAVKQGLGRTFKSQLKESIIQPNSYKLVGGTLSKRLTAYGAEGVVDGGLSGGVYSGVETAKNGGDAGDILKATAIGFGTGALMGGIMTSAAHGKGIVTGNKGAVETLSTPSLSEIDKIARHDEINQANLSPHRFNDVSGKKAQKQVSDYLDNILSKIPENTPEASSVNNVKKYADFILPDGTLISRNHAGDTGLPVFDKVTGKFEVPDVENAVLFWIKDTEGKEHVLPALTPENVSKAKRIISYISNLEEIPRSEINDVQAKHLAKLRGKSEVAVDAVETSLTKNSDDVVQTPKAQEVKGIEQPRKPYEKPTIEKISIEAEDEIMAAPAPKPQGAENKPHINDLDFDNFDWDEIFKSATESTPHTTQKTEIEMLRDAIYNPASDNSYKISREVFTPEGIVEVLPQVKTQNELNIIKEKLNNIIKNSNPDEYKKLRSVQKLVGAKEDEFAAKCYSHMDELADHQMTPNYTDFKRIITQQIKETDNIDELIHLQSDLQAYKKQVPLDFSDIEKLINAKSSKLHLDNILKNTKTIDNLETHLKQAQTPEAKAIIAKRIEERKSEVLKAYDDFKAGKSIPDYETTEDIVRIKIEDCKTLKDIENLTNDLRLRDRKVAEMNLDDYGAGAGSDMIRAKSKSIRTDILNDFTSRIEKINTEKEAEAIKNEFLKFQFSDNYYSNLSSNNEMRLLYEQVYTKINDKLKSFKPSKLDFGYDKNNANAIKIDDLDWDEIIRKSLNEEPDIKK